MYVNLVVNFKMTVYHCLGNHDANHIPLKETMKAYRMPNDYDYFDCEEFRMIVLNLSYYPQKSKDDPSKIEYIPFHEENYFYLTEDYDGIMPPDEMEWLKKVLEESPYPCVLISHQNIERTDGIINAEEVREVINNANRKHKHRVMLVTTTLSCRSYRYS